MKYLSINIRIKIPIHLKRIKFLEVGSAENYIDERQTELSIENVKENFLPLLDKIESLFGLNSKCKINLILGEFFLRLLCEEKMRMKNVIGRIKRLHQIGAVQVALEGSPEFFPNMFGQILKKQTAVFQTLFNVIPNSYVCNKSNISVALEQEIYNCGYRNVIGVTNRNNIWSDEPQLLLLGKKTIDRLITKFGVDEVFKMAFDYNEKKHIMLDFHDALGLINACPDIGILMSDQNHSYVGIDECTLRGAKVVKRKLAKNDAPVVLKNELQAVVWKQLTKLNNAENKLEDDVFMDQYSLLCQKELFGLMNTDITSNYSFKNPYESPYSTYINMMNILKDLEVKVGKNIH